MPKQVSQINNQDGLASSMVAELRQQYGYNVLSTSKQHYLLKTLLDIVREPMFILLSAACILYFILGNSSEGIMMAIAMAIISAISVYQELRSSRAISALKELTEPLTTVIREGRHQNIDSKELVPGDLIILAEGSIVPADAVVLQSNDLSINESVITGESIPVNKSENGPENILYQGTLLNSGKCIALVTATGNQTELGKMNKAIESFHESKTPLQEQVNKVVQKLAVFGLMAFVLIFLINYASSGVLASSFLVALTLAMSAIPEEIPVAFNSFFALGAYRLSKLGIIASRPQIIESLGAVNVVCLDKTGTITENRMVLRTIYDPHYDCIYDLENRIPDKHTRLLLYATLASESSPFDAMEKAIVAAYNQVPDPSEYKQWQMVHEYPLQGQPPMMTHLYTRSGNNIAAAKGAPERIITVCRLNTEERRKIEDHSQALASKGYRVLGVASAVPDINNLPDSQDDFAWQFEGLLALYDPPRESMNSLISGLYDAKVNVKMITGDSAATAVNIAGQVGIEDAGHFKTGNDIMQMTTDELHNTVMTTNIFARMFPDAKLKVIQALQSNGNVVAMTGDGVNDGPALKAADIGIAMGKRGSETARRASDLVLTSDNLPALLTAISNGRTIYQNLVKAIRYILSIHIPIILTAAMPVILGWKYPNIFTPIHVIFLELIMGPTCSIFFEREPGERNIMQSGPRKKDRGLFTRDEILMSVTQGLVVAFAVLLLYFIYMKNGHSLELTRMMVFTTIIIANVFLTFSSRSFHETVFRTFSRKNSLAKWIVLASGLFLLILQFSIPAQQLFGLHSLSLLQFLLCVATAFVSVMWVEVFKKDLQQPA